MIKSTNIAEGAIEEKHLSKELKDRLGIGDSIDKQELVVKHEALQAGWYPICDVCEYLHVVVRVCQERNYEENTYVVRNGNLLVGPSGKLKVDSGIIYMYLNNMANVVLHLTIMTLN